MAIDRVTITGADDSVCIASLIALSREFPFVEWGILASSNNTIHGGCQRYPSPMWIHDLQVIAAKTGSLPRLALHINGLWVRKLLLGDFIVPPGLLTGFARVQLNFHAERTTCNSLEFAQCLQKHFAGKDLIFQLDGQRGNDHLDSAQEHETNRCFGLFDASGGAGIVPEQWPTPIYIDPGIDMNDNHFEQHAYHGYAGGLGPHNLADEIPKILAASAGTEFTKEGSIWIDMETHVRSNTDLVFDLDKVRRCLEISSCYVKPTSVK